MYKWYLSWYDIYPRFLLLCGECIHKKQLSKKKKKNCIRKKPTWGIHVPTRKSSNHDNYHYILKSKIFINLPGMFVAEGGDSTWCARGFCTGLPKFRITTLQNYGSKYLHMIVAYFVHGFNIFSIFLIFSLSQFIGI